MKRLNNQLDVDFIGGEGGLTKKEETALSTFFKKKRVTKEKVVHLDKKKKALKDS